MNRGGGEVQPRRSSDQEESKRKAGRLRLRDKMSDKEGNHIGSRDLPDTGHGGEGRGREVMEGIDSKGVYHREVGFGGSSGAG